MTTRYLPDERMVCTGYWYARQADLLPYGGPADPSDREFLLELGKAASRLARWHGIPERKTAEGPYRVHQWPEWVWSSAADALGQHAADHGDYELEGIPATRVVHVQRERCDVYIGRPGPWGNPYVIGQHGTREQVISAYEAYLRSRPDLLAAVPSLRGKVLGCWCAPLPCHGDVLARIADQISCQREDPVHPHGYWEAGDYDDVPWDSDDMISPAELAWAEASLSARWSEKGY